MVIVSREIVNSRSKTHKLYKVTDDKGNTASSNISYERAEEILLEYFY